MIVACPACGRKNRVPDVPLESGSYNCAACGQVFSSLDDGASGGPSDTNGMHATGNRNENPKISDDLLEREKQFKERLRESDKQLDLVFALEYAIAVGADQCSVAVTERGQGETPPQAVMLIFFEFIYFFAHLTLRYVSQHDISEASRANIQNYLGPSLARLSVSKFCEHWPDDYKARMRDEFFENLNRAEMEYARCVGLSAGPLPSPLFTGNSLLATLGRNVAELAGEELNPMTMAIVHSVTIQAIGSLKFEEKVAQIAEYGNLTYDFDLLQGEIDNPI